MAVDGAQPFVQLNFTDQPGIGYPGQQYRASPVSASAVLSFPAGEGPVFCGRMVAIGTAIDYSNNEAFNKVPYSIRLLTSSDDATALVGVVTRPFQATQNFVDPDPNSGEDKAGFGEKDQVPVVEVGSKEKIIVRQDPGLGAVTQGTAVYVAIEDSTTNAAAISIGEFGNAAGTGMLLVPNAIWYLTKTATSNDAVNVIQLL